MPTREERIAMNEATAREMNEQIDEALEDRPSDRSWPIVCECGYAGCEEILMITPDEYAQVRRHARRFAVARDHVIQDVERVVVETGGLVIVSKREGAPADVARERHDPS